MIPSLSKPLFICLNLLAQIKARIIMEMLKRKLTNHRGVMLVRAFLMIEKDEPQIAVARMIPPAAKAFWVVVLLVILVRPSVLMLLLVNSIYTDKY